MADLFHRVSIRKFKDETVSSEDIGYILEAAMAAPSAKNQQPWEFYVIQDILHDRRKITADTSLRLAKYFGVSDKYFLDIQTDIDIRNLKLSEQEELDSIPVCPTMV